MKSKTLNTIVVIISISIFLSVFIFTNGLGSLFIIFKTLDFEWIVYGALCMVAFWLMEAIILYMIIRITHTESGLFVKALKIAMIGQFFGAITPLQTGAQPAQLYAMKENGLLTNHSGSTLLIKFIIHQSAFTLYAFIVFLLNFNYFNLKIQYFLPFCFLGFIINILILMLLLFSVSKRMADNKSIIRIFLFILKLFNKLKIIKNTITSENELKAHFIEFQESATFISTNRKVCGYALVLTFLQWTIYYTVPYCIYRSFGYSSSSVFTMIAAQVFVTLFMSFIPLPGAAGGAEGGFFIIFGVFFKANMIVPAIFMWRLMTYYSTILIGSLFTLLYANPSSKK